MRLRRPEPVAEFDLGRVIGPVTLGRAPGNRVVIDDPHVSAIHGQIVRLEAGVFYQDLHSTNGSALERDGRRQAIPAGAIPGVQLRPGDRLLLGSESGPVVLEVLDLEIPAEGGDEPSVTMVAQRRLAEVGRLSGELERSGHPLRQFLELWEALAESGADEAAAQTLSSFLSRAVPGFVGLALLEDDRPELAPEPRLVAKDLHRLAALAPRARSDELGVWQLSAGRHAVLLRLPLVPAPVAALVFGRPPETLDLDTLSLGLRIFASRLRQLRQLTQAEEARRRLTARSRYLSERAEPVASLLGESPALQALREQIRTVSPSNATVLVLGPSGSGKELVAREIHRQSLRHAEIFVAVNCGALVESLLEVELFGCRKGAFTGAVRDREGLFEVAHAGTLFLDEIGEMSPGLQVKLLRVLETGELTPVGATRPRRVDVRVVAATHRDLAVQVRQGRFREDLFYRLNVFPIRVPPLSERREDIPLLARHFLRRFSGDADADFSEEALRLLCARDYPGNVRQLSNEVQRAALLAAGAGRVLPEHLSAGASDAERACAAAGRGTLREKLMRVERVLVDEALERCAGNRTAAARELGITRQALLQKLNRLKDS
ncbi:MAG: sigma 54-interacting transcriptional regulator [Myxococcales bacterium]|nr:sigma 54-interacting transcriptional regulator [Myxococcales bacterium]